MTNTSIKLQKNPKKLRTQGTQYLFIMVEIATENDLICSSLYNPKGLIFLNSSDWLEHVAMLLTSTLAINC